VAVVSAPPLPYARRPATPPPAGGSRLLTVLIWLIYAGAVLVGALVFSAMLG